MNLRVIGGTGLLACREVAQSGERSGGEVGQLRVSVRRKKSKTGADDHLGSVTGVRCPVPGSSRYSQAGMARATSRARLAELLMAECDDRARRRSERRIKAAGFPRQKSLRAFDFDANPNIDPAVVNTLATCDWVKKGLPLCLIGDSGTGKSHLLIAFEPRPPWPATACATRWPPSSSTS